MYWTKTATGFSTLYQYVLDENCTWFLYFIPICTSTYSNRNQICVITVRVEMLLFQMY